MQSAPSAQPLRCGLAPSSQSQPDPHIAFIYLWNRVSEGRRRRRREKVGAGDRGGVGRRGPKKKGKSKSFVFTHTESLPETLDHISDSLLSSLLTQSHVKDWWGRWWTKINQSHSHSHRQTAKKAGQQTVRPSALSKTRPPVSLAKSRSALKQWRSGRSFSSSLLPSFVNIRTVLNGEHRMWKLNSISKRCFCIKQSQTAAIWQLP